MYFILLLSKYIDNNEFLRISNKVDSVLVCFFLSHKYVTEHDKMNGYTKWQAFLSMRSCQ